LRKECSGTAAGLVTLRHAINNPKKGEEIMRKRIISSLVLGVAAMLTLGASNLQAQGKCNLETIKGAFGYLNTGTAFGTALASVGSMTFDGAGNIAGTDTNSFGGAISTTPFTGTYTVNGDCTGTLTVNFGFFSVNNHIVIVDNGKEINLIETNAGTIATGVMKRQ